jgi:hypothetical protein
MEQTKTLKKVTLKEYHSKEYLKKKAKDENIIFVLPNGKEIEFNKKEAESNDK